MATIKYRENASAPWEIVKALPSIGQTVEITATELAAKSTADRAAMYAAGTRLLKVINNDTEVLLGLDADGSTEWLGSNKPLNNLLDNSNFANVVNQRGQSSYTGTGYGVDRWYGIDYTISISDENIELNKSGGGNGYLIQYLALETLQYEKSYTMAINLANGITLCGNATYSESTNQLLFLLKDNIALSIDKLTSQNKLQAVVTLIQGNLLLKSAALYEGSYTADTLPPYTPKGYAAELAECQRYYLSIRPSAGFVNSAASGAYFQAASAIRMRAIPSVARYAVTTLRVNGATILPAEIASVAAASTSSVLPIAIVQSSSLSGKANQPIIFEGTIDFSADL